MIRLIYIALILSVSLSSCLTYEDVEFKDVEDVRVENLFSDPVLNIDVKVNNPNGYAIKIKDADLNLYVGSKDLGKLKLGEKIKIPRKSESSQTIIIKPDRSDIVKMAVSGASESILTGKIKVRIKGKIKGQVMGVGKWIDVSHTEYFKPKDLMKYLKG